jgi:serine/threonine-protein kinase
MAGPGTVLAERYRLEERIGGGAMGEVWRGTDLALDRIIAVKVVRQELLDEPGFRDRFLVEARTMARIKHHGVVAVHDYYSDETRAFLVMEYVEGESLSRRLYRDGRLDPIRTMTLVAQAGDALQAAHDNGVVHRDVKPGNLLVTTTDSVVLTDFGIARSVAATPLTATGVLVGTVSYLAPEQVLGKPATPRSDVYALGVVAYECLSGRRPFDGENPFDVAMRRLREPPPTLAGDIPPAVLAVLDRALAPDPDQRWPSAAEFARAARGVVAPGSAGRASIPAQRIRPAPAPSGAPLNGPPSGPPSRPPSGQPLAPRPQSPYHPPPGTAAPVRPQPTPATTGFPPPGYAVPGLHPPPAGPRPPGQQQNILGTLGLIFGVLGIMLSICCYLGLPISVAGIVLGALGMKKVSDGVADNRSMALAGVVCGVAGTVLAGILFIVLTAADFYSY